MITQKIIHEIWSRVDQIPFVRVIDQSEVESCERVDG